MKRTIGLVLALLASPVLAQQAPTGLGQLDGAFSRDQGQRGRQVFANDCQSCHTAKQASELMLDRSGGKALSDFVEFITRQMPPEGGANRPSTQGYLDIAAFLADTAGARSGQRDVAYAETGWRALIIPAAGMLATAPAKSTLVNLDWRNWRGDIGGAGYSPADQIDRTNAANLYIAWRWTSASQGPTPEARSITTPIMVDGALYFTAGMTRNVIAVDAASGETLWMWRSGESAERYENAPRKGAGRGVAYWRSGADARIFTVTPGFHLAALDAKTGRPVPAFGKAGVVDLMQGLRGLPKHGLADIGNSSPPLVIGNVVVVGPAHLIGFKPKSKANVKGDVRGYDVRTGKLLWTFHTIPAKGEAGYETWEKGSVEFTGNTGVWAPMSADPKTGAIFLPVEDATGDRYGGLRPGSNLYSSSLVSLDAKTGKVRWARQLIHHDIWDWDTPSIPILGEVKQGGKTRRIVAQISKQAFVYVFDRDTGEPLWPMPEQAVTRSDTPGETSWPTQPFPSKPAPFDRQGLNADALIDFTPELRAEAVAAVKPYRLGPLFAPPSVQGAADGTRGTLTLPGPLGGGNWEGGVFDPEMGMLYVGSSTQLALLSIEPAPEGSDAGYVVAEQRPPQVRGLPLVKPPYGRITAIDLNSGDHVWMKPNGDTPRSIKTNPALAGLSIPPTGKPTRAGLLVTKTLLFAGEGVGGDPVLHVLDKSTGATIADVALPGSQGGLPMTYVWKGRQYVAMAIGDGVNASEIVALAAQSPLPD